MRRSRFWISSRLIRLLIQIPKPKIQHQMISVAEAIAIIKQTTRALPSERVALADALDRILAEDVIADSDLPPFNRAQMDGYAVRSSDVAAVPARLRIAGESAAGLGWHHEMKAGEACGWHPTLCLPMGCRRANHRHCLRPGFTGL